MHGHRLRAVFAQVHRAQAAVAAQRMRGIAVVVRAQADACAHPRRALRPTGTSRPGAGSARAICSRADRAGVADHARARRIARAVARAISSASTKLHDHAERDRAADRAQHRDRRQRQQAEHQQRDQAADDHRVQRAQLLVAVVAGVLEEQRVIEAEAGGEDQRDQVEQVQLDPASRAAPRGSAAWSAPSARARAARGAAMRSAIHTVAASSSAASASAHSTRSRYSTTSDSDACLRSSSCAPCGLRDARDRGRDRASPLSDTSAVAWPPRSQQQAADAGRQRRAVEVAHASAAARGARRRHRRGSRRTHRLRNGVARDRGVERGLQRRRVRQPRLARALRARRWAGSARRGRSRRSRRRRRSCSQRRPQAFAAPAARLRHRAPSSAST